MNKIMFWDIQQIPAFDLESKLRSQAQFQLDKTIIDYAGVSTEQGEGKLLEKMESMSLIQSKDALVICLIDSIEKGLGGTGHTPANYVRQLSRLVCAYPEVTFRFIEDLSESTTSSFKGDSPKCFIGIQDIRAAIESFELGQRDVFDPYGIRAAIRSAKWMDDDSSEVENIEKTLASFAARPCSYILEDEWDYSELVGYCAYRSGKYQVRPILISREIQANMDDFKLGDYLQEGHGGVLIHALDILDWKNARKRESFDVLSKSEIERMVITGAGTDVVRLTSPSDWKNSSDHWLAWTPEKDSKLFWKNKKVPNLRGLPKPLEWIHDIQNHGLLPAWNQQENEKFTFLDGIVSKKDGHHSARLEAQETAQQLLNRSRIALKSDEPLLAAIFSLEAVRWLRGYSSTLLLDSVQSLYEAETELELGLGSSGRSSRTEAPCLREKELKKLMEMLSGSHKMPKAQVPEMKERIWTSLRRRYLDVGAFEPAEEALTYIHDAHWERIGQVSWSLRSFFPKLMLYFPKTLLGRIILLFLAAGLILVTYEAPLIETNPLDPAGWYSPWPFLTLATPFIVLFSLVGLWAHQWPSAALSPVRWAVTVFLSIAVLSAGNLALLSDPSNSTVIKDHRWRAYSEAVAWTCGGALAQVLPNKFIHAHRELNPPLASLSFGWRGKTVRREADQDLNGVEDTQRFRTYLWLENVIAGWLSFATGLSTIYRKASRS